MTVLPGNQQYSPSLQDIALQLKSNPDFYNMLGGAVGFSTEPLLSIANDVMSRILAENMPWKWNRAIVPPFLTVSLQQDYCTNITDIGWLENGWIVDINNSVSNNNGAPKPIRPLETVRDQFQTSGQNVPFNVSYIQNSLAFMGLWQANTAYSGGYGVAQLPRSPIQQFIDANGNILYIDSTNLGLNIESPGFVGQTVTPPGFSPYGVSGSVEPLAPVGATPGTLITDGTVTWTVADPDAYALRFKPVPALNGLCWWAIVNYQKVPPQITKLSQKLDPIPYNMIYLFRAGLRAALYRENGDRRGNDMYAEWEKTLMKSVRAADRQAEDFVATPIQGVFGGAPMYGGAFSNIGASQPFGPAFWRPI